MKATGMSGPRRVTHQEADVYAVVVGKAIGLLREHRGLMQTELATSAGITQSMLSRMERGQTQPDYFTTEKLARALGMASSVEFGKLVLS